MIQRIFRALLWFMVILSPVFVSMVLMQKTHSMSLFQAYPFWSDEIWYWHQAKSFAEVGFDSGFYTIKEVPAPAEFSPFNAWGAFIPALYGSAALLTGWTIHSIVIFNLICLALSIALFLWALRPSPVQAVLVGLLMATYSPILLYTYTSMITVFQMAIGTALAAGFIVVLRYRHVTPRPVVILLAVSIVLAGLVRLTWIFFYFPFVLLLARRLTWKRTALAFGVTSTVFLGAASFLVLTGAPYPNVLSAVLGSVSENPIEAISILMRNVSENIALLDEGDIFEIAYRQQAALFSGLLMLSAGRLWLKQRRQDADQFASGDTAPLHAAGMILFLIGVFFAFTILVYDVKLSRDFRLLAPVLLFGFLLSIAYRQWSVIIPVAITIASMLPGTLHVYTIWTDWHVDPAGRNAYYAWNAEIAKHVQYEPDAPNRWCNTLLHSHLYMWTQTHVVMSVPAGIGLSTTFEQQDMPPPYKSRWLMFTEEEFSQYENMPDVVPLLEVPDGKLYYNRESACDSVPDTLR